MKYILTQICEHSFDQRLLVVDEDKSIILFDSKADANEFKEKTGENPEDIMIIPEMEFLNC